MEKYITRYMRERRKNDPEFKKRLNIHQNKCQRKTRLKIKNTIYEILGGYKCNCKGINCWHVGECNISDKRILQLDHINNDGCKQRNTMYNNEIYIYYYHHLEEAKKEIQVLCANCNWLKRHI